MNKIVLFLICVFACNALHLNAQENVLIEINDTKVTVDEFLHIYKKNNTDEHAMSLEAMNDYMDLFINFKLKVIEAESLGLDTSKSFINELEGYRNQLAQPYLSDKSVEEALIKEAYERMKSDVKVSHILILADQNASPEDTLRAWDKINQVYKRLQNGEDFKLVAQQMSEDESVKFNNGDLGWRTVFGLVYPFETQMYNTPVGDFSEPFRTNYGYHVLLVTDKRPAKGRYKVAHIMITTPRQMTPEQKQMAEERLQEVLTKIDEGEDFGALAREYSEDRRTAQSDGVLGWIEVGGKMIQNFEEAVFELDTVGQISDVLTTSYGYHIIKLLEKESIKSFEEEKAMLKSRISNSARATKSRKSVIEKLKKEYNAKINLEALEPFYSLVTDSLFSGTWNPEEAFALNGELLSFGDVVYTQSDFARFIDTRNRKQQPQNVRTFIDQSFDNFVDKKIVAYEQAGLEKKYPQFYYLMKEYHDGILLFELTDQMVWSKAITDTVGLEAFYQANKENYWWDKRYEVTNYKCNNEKSSKYLQKKLKKERDWTWIDDHCNKKDSAAVRLIDTGKYLIGQNTLVDQVVKKSGLEDKSDGYKVMQNDNNVVVTIKLIPPAQKTLKDARGMVTADYQNLLEKQWIEQLRAKYKITVHQDVLETIAE